MARSKHSSPTLKLRLTDEARDRAIKSNSGGCLVADAIREQYPQFTGIVVDMATIRFTDREAGVRYTYLTNSPAQHCLLSFDQGWPNPVEELTIKRAVKIDPVTRPKNGPGSALGRQEYRVARIAELEAREALAPLPRQDKVALTRMRNAPPPRIRPTSNGPIDIKVVDRGSQHGAVIHGGRPIPPRAGPPEPFAWT